MNLLNIVKNYLPVSLVQQTAQQTGESESSISNLMNAAIPSVIAGLIAKSQTDSNGLFSLVTSAANAGILNKLGSIADINQTSNAGSFNIWTMLQQLFGDKLQSLVSALSGFAGVKASSAQTVLGLSGAATLGATGNYVAQNNLDANGLSAFLQDQQSHLASSVPAGFDLSKVAGVMGLGSLLANKPVIDVNNISNVPPPPAYSSHPEPPQKGNGWLVPLIILAALGGLIWYLMKSCNKEAATSNSAIEAPAAPAGDTANPQPQTPPAAVTGAVDTSGNWVSDWGAEQTIKLADGTELKVGQNATEYKLYQFITDAGMQIDTVDKTKNWISFDRVYFETGKSVLTQASQNQIKNIALILKNYPNATIKIGGYTDNTGDAAINKKISDERAKVVGKELIKSGAAAKQVVESVGYGPEHPIAANDTEEGKAQNRRVDLKVASK
ncbi:MAG: DUF937 domain-containing protein [Sphingobacteriales bacterium]|nr:MAG: DUF937 domain-containing protein [Sphingobacteriales bacterium]